MCTTVRAYFNNTRHVKAIPLPVAETHDVIIFMRICELIFYCARDCIKFHGTTLGTIMILNFAAVHR